MSKYRVIKRMEISGAHRLSLPYESKCRGLHGHNWIITVFCESETLDENGMVVDFSKIKELVHGKLDHQFLNPAGFATAFRTVTKCKFKKAKATSSSTKNKRG